MIQELDPAWGPFLFDTSAERWLARNARDPQVERWMAGYLDLHKLHVSAITVLERIRGYSKSGATGQRDRYLATLGQVVPVNLAVAIASGELLTLAPEPPSPPQRSHQNVESRASRAGRWRFDVMIGATALVFGMRLLHNNAVDFETIRGIVENHPDRFRGAGPLQLTRITRIANA